MITAMLTGVMVGALIISARERSRGQAADGLFILVWAYLLTDVVTSLNWMLSGEAP